MLCRDDIERFGGQHFRVLVVERSPRSPGELGPRNPGKDLSIGWYDCRRGHHVVHKSDLSPNVDQLPETQQRRQARIICPSRMGSLKIATVRVHPGNR